MTTTLYDPAVLAQLSPEHLLEAWAEADAAVRDAERYRHAIERAIDARMEADRAEVLEHGGLIATRRAKPVWDKSRLEALREYLSPAEWDALLTVPKPPPPRELNMTKVKPLVKRGGTIRSIIEAAQTPSVPVLAVRRTTG